MKNLTKEVSENLNAKQKQRLVKNESKSNPEFNNKFKTPTTSISTEDIVKIKLKHNLSNKTVLVEKNHSIDKNFTAEKVKFTIIKNKIETSIDKTVIYCKVLIGFITHVKESRNESNVHLKLGIDGGGRFLKLFLSIQSYIDDEISSITNKKNK